MLDIFLWNGIILSENTSLYCCLVVVVFVLESLTWSSDGSKNKTAVLNHYQALSSGELWHYSRNILHRNMANKEKRKKHIEKRL